MNYLTDASSYSRTPRNTQRLLLKGAPNNLTPGFTTLTFSSMTTIAMFYANEEMALPPGPHFSITSVKLENIYDLDIVATSIYAHITSLLGDILYGKLMISVI
jgi:hypothetical protein